MDESEKEELNPRAKKLIDDHLKSRVAQAFAIVGIVNIGALFGIYTLVSETAAELAVEKAISSTETQLQGLTKQFEQLSTRTTDGFANALMSLGDAKAKVDAINQDVLGLKNLDLKQVKEATELLNKSSDEIVSIIEATKALKEINRLKEDLDAKVSVLNGNIQDNKKELIGTIHQNAELIKKIDRQFSTTQRNAATVYKLGDMLIETGVVFFNKSSHISQIKFDSEFKSTPAVIANGVSNNKYDYGYPIVGDITTKGFSCTLSDKVANNNKTLIRTGGKIDYIAIGEIKR